ncbi:hypothetical protein H2198_003340 [Neophaeococcomyces mojaviensis]|uniref:Uncharacterized protein n=1 Tax=Neophaeococcomyces mojaviensis TaxID=3383035 RepID=A0ACC3ABJ0_9EURO|nr:hypothetical protein H2198_003340 [Knufia sp. JES_112]
MSTTSPIDPAITEILTFWFNDLPREAWFMPPPELDLDTTITTRFLTYVERAINTTDLDHWTQTPEGTLALILLLDQFPRNIYRANRHPQPHLSFSGDRKAQGIASTAISKGFDRAIESQFAKSGGKTYRYFVYMPLMHAEDLVAQVACVALTENMQLECLLAQAEKTSRGEVESEEEKKMMEWLGVAVPFAKRHRNCVELLGRFPKRNEALGREHSLAEKEWLEKNPSGF